MAKKSKHDRKNNNYDKDLRCTSVDEKVLTEAIRSLLVASVEDGIDESQAVELVRILANKSNELPSSEKLEKNFRERTSPDGSSSHVVTEFKNNKYVIYSKEVTIRDAVAVNENSNKADDGRLFDCRDKRAEFNLLQEERDWVKERCRAAASLLTVIAALLTVAIAISLVIWQWSVDNKQVPMAVITLFGAAFAVGTEFRWFREWVSQLLFEKNFNPVHRRMLEELKRQSQDEIDEQNDRGE